MFLLLLSYYKEGSCDACTSEDKSFAIWGWVSPRSVAWPSDDGGQGIMIAGLVLQQKIEDKATFFPMKRREMRSWGEYVAVINAEFKRTSSGLCFKVQSVALNSLGFPQKSLSLFAVVPGSEIGRFIWFYRGTKELLCSAAPFPLNGLCDKTNFSGVKVPGMLVQCSPFAKPCGEWKPQDRL